MSKYTKSGFPKRFSCCDKFAYCDMGRKTCWFVEIDPETMESCGAWARVNQPMKAHKRVITPVEILEMDEPVDLVVPVLVKEMDLVGKVPVKTTEKEQLTLF